MRRRRANRMAHPGRCDRPSWIGFGASPSDEIFSPWTVQISGSRSWSREGRTWAWTLTGTLRRKLEQRYPLTPAAAGPLRYLKAPSFWHSPSIPAASWAFPGGRTWRVWYRRQACCQTLGVDSASPVTTGPRPASGAPILEPTRAIALPLPVIPDLSEFKARPLSTPPLVLHTSLTSPERGNFRNSIL